MPGDSKRKLYIIHWIRKSQKKKNLKLENHILDTELQCQEIQKNLVKAELEYSDISE
jgi:hypothetical protein